MFSFYIDGPQQSTFHGRLNTGTIALLSSTSRFVCTLSMLCNGSLSVAILQTDVYTYLIVVECVSRCCRMLCFSMFSSEINKCDLPVPQEVLAYPLMQVQV